MSRQTKSLSSKFLRGLNFFLLIVFAFLCVYPLYFIFINSISGADAVVRGVYILPEDFSLEFYKSLLQMPNILRNPRTWIPPTLAAAITGPSWGTWSPRASCPCASGSIASWSRRCTSTPG